jgi:hypothetical protein
MELGWSTHVAQPARSLLNRLEPEFVAIEGPRALEVLGRELGDGMGVAEWSGHRSSPQLMQG